MKYGFVIPVYNHGAALEAVVKNLLEYQLPIIVVDDGNDEKNKAYINDIAQRYPLVTLVVRPKNGGKGAAMKDGVQKAYEMGLTHILQLDSDGQHDAARVAGFLEKSRQNPEAIICGYPEYDASAPKHRVNGRKIANAWIHFVTLSNDIVDAMIGFRVYPVLPYIKLTNSHAYLDARMGYDIDILVRLYWRNVPVISEPVKVFYPSDGISNFRNVRDNLRIAGTYARLCIGMLLRLPLLIARKRRHV
ncbi:MAG: glycosyltransferase family 2 protein [Treponema sp.]|nr:glycosyltransferase family 2 protein [Treponema sp.]